jgi:CheY-like chemotaxis protein
LFYPAAYFNDWRIKKRKKKRYNLLLLKIENKFVVLLFRQLINQAMQRTNNPLIFIVQENVIYKELIVGYLQQKKYTNLKTFKTAEECLKSISQKPDIIVLDYSFQGITGLELMKRVKAEYPEIDFVFLSGQNDVEVAVNIMKMGAADYVVKNNKAPEALVKSIQYLLSKNQAHKVKKGFQVGVIGFFIMLFFIIMIIILMTIFLEDFSLS